MNISAKAIVSNSDMIKNYKGCREKAESFGKIFVLKTSRTPFYFPLPNMKGFQVLLSIWKALKIKIWKKSSSRCQRKESAEDTHLTI